MLHTLLSLELVHSCTAVQYNGRNFSRSSISGMQIYLSHFSTANQPQNIYLQFFQQNKKKETVGRSYAIFNTSFFYFVSILSHLFSLFLFLRNFYYVTVPRIPLVLSPYVYCWALLNFLD